MPIRKFKMFMRSIASMLCFFMAIYPFHSFGIEPGAVGREGQSYGKQISNAFHFPVESGGMIEFSDGEFFDPSDFAPKGEGLYVNDPDIGGLQGVYDSDEAMEGVGLDAQHELYIDASKSEPETLSGAAYQIVLRAGSARNEFPDLTNDAIVSRSGVAAFDQGLIDSFGDCSVETNITGTSSPVHVPDKYYCTRVNIPKEGLSCKIRNKIELTSGLVDETVRVVGVPLNGSHRKTYAKIHNPYDGAGVLDHLYDDICGPNSLDATIYVSVPAYYASLPHTSVGGASVNIDPPYAHGGGAHTIVTEGDSIPGLLNPSNYGGLRIEQPSCANGLTVKFDSYSASRWSEYVNIAKIDLDVTYKVTGTVIDKEKSGWGPRECINRALRWDEDFCETTSTVSAGATDDQQCIRVWDKNGIEHPICPGNFLYNQLDPSPVPGIPKLATEVTVVSVCGGFNVGEMDCYEDIHGEVHCPYNEGELTDDCQELEENSSCSVTGSACVEGARGYESGYCYVSEDEYDCGFSVNIPSYEKSESYDCGGPIRCMGADCLDPMEPPSAANDFAKAAALLDAAESMSQDMNCNPDGTGCTIFSGEAKECKTAVGGTVNCCEKPKGVSLTEYITVIRAAPKFNSAMVKLADSTNPMNVVGKGYKALADPVAGTFKTITKPVAGHIENISGAIKGMKDTAIETIDKIATKAVNTVKGAFGKGVGSAAEIGAAEAGAEAASESIVSTIMNSPAMAYLQTVMMIYTIYVVATVIISIIWKCTQDEFELGTKRQLKSCTKVGSYCKKKVLGSCIEKRESFCCFSSPLSRIMQEQIRPQLGMGFGSAKSPDCSGIPIERFGHVNWDGVDLDEWLGILQATNNFPATSGLSLENMTGAGSNFDTGERLNTLDRNLNRLEGIDADNVRGEAAKTVPITTGKPFH